MWFILLKIFKFGFNQAKKHNANKKAAQHGDDLSNPSSFNMADPRAFAQPSPPPPRKPLKHYLALTLHALQLVFAIAVLALYGSEVHHAHERSDSATPESVYAVVTAMLACVTALGMLGYEVLVKPRGSGGKAGLLMGMFAWLGIVVILWLVVFGVFAAKFLGSEKKKMRRAVWVDLVCLAMAVGAAAWAGLRWWRGNREEDGEREVKEEEKEAV